MVVVTVQVHISMHLATTTVVMLFRLVLTIQIVMAWVGNGLQGGMAVRAVGSKLLQQELYNVRVMT
jgi:hypothetical protein